MIELLLDAGADTEAKDLEFGQTSLIWATRKGHAEVVKQLLEAGADIEAKDRDGRTSLSWAARKRRDEVVKLLLEAGADSADLGEVRK